MKRLFLIFLILIMCCACSCSNGHNNITETPDNNENAFIAPDLYKDMAKYLESKYGGEYSCCGYTTDETEFLFTSSFEWKHPVTVYLSSKLIEQGFPDSDFTEQFADDGYFMAMEDNIENYYSKLFEKWGVHRILVGFNTTAIPSAVTTTMSYANAVKQYPSYMNNTIYVLTNTDISDAAIQSVMNTLAKEPNDVKVIVFKVDETKQGNLTVDELAAGTNYTVLYTGTNRE